MVLWPYMIFLAFLHNFDIENWYLVIWEVIYVDFDIRTAKYWKSDRWGGKR